MNKKTIISFLCTLVIVVPTAVILRMNEVDRWMYIIAIGVAYLVGNALANLFVKDEDSNTDS